MTAPLIIKVRGLGPSLLIVARGLGKVFVAALLLAFACALVHLLSYLLIALYVVYLLVSGPT
jgi:hypothetical protein